jgi:hypothetical protein
MRWHSAGKPDLDKFKEAGCPTPSAWRKLQGEPARRTKKKKPATKKAKATAASSAAALTTSKSAPATKQDEAVASTPTELTVESTDARVSIKVVSVSYEGDGTSINTILQQIAGLFR